ncbi:hypothetical protein CR513_31572, partial [Mucuna pruriens]
MLDLGASINVMPTSIYKSLNFGDLEPIRMTIQLVNRNVVQPLGVLEDVLVQVNELIFLPNFYSILDNQVQNLVPTRSDSSTMKNADFDSNQPRAKSIPANISQPQKQKVKIMSAHLVSDPNQVGQSDPKLTNDTSSSPPPPIELKSLPSHLKYAYLDTE